MFLSSARPDWGEYGRIWPLAQPIFGETTCRPAHCDVLVSAVTMVLSTAATISVYQRKKKRKVTWSADEPWSQCSRARGKPESEEGIDLPSQLEELQEVKDTLKLDTLVRWEGARACYRHMTYIMRIATSQSLISRTFKLVLPILQIPAVPSKSALIGTLGPADVDRGSKIAPSDSSSYARILAEVL